MPESQFQPPPILRDLFPKTGRTMPRRYNPAQIAPWCEKLVEVMNRTMPVRAELVSDGPYKMSIRVDVVLPELPSAEPGQEASDTP